MMPGSFTPKTEPGPRWHTPTGTSPGLPFFPPKKLIKVLNFQLISNFIMATYWCLSVWALSSRQAWCIVMKSLELTPAEQFKMCDKGWMSSLRVGHTACLGPDHNVVVFGGSSNMCTMVCKEMAAPLQRVWLQKYIQIMTTFPSVVVVLLIRTQFWKVLRSITVETYSAFKLSRTPSTGIYWKHVLMFKSTCGPGYVYLYAA